MADFTVIVASGATVGPWLDPADGDDPSRLNPKVGYPHRRFLGTVGTPIVVHAVVGGVTSPPDSSLGGRLFVPFVVEQPVGTVDMASVGAESSICQFTPTKVGHYHFRVRRPQGGIWHMHFDVEAP